MVPTRISGADRQSHPPHPRDNTGQGYLKSSYPQALPGLVADGAQAPTPKLACPAPHNISARPNRSGLYSLMDAALCGPLLRSGEPISPSQHRESGGCGARCQRPPISGIDCGGDPNRPRNSQLVIALLSVVKRRRGQHFESRRAPYARYSTRKEAFLAGCDPHHHAAGLRPRPQNLYCASR